MTTHVINLWPFMVLEYSLLCQQEPSTGHDSESDVMCTLPRISLRFEGTLHLCLCLTMFSFLQDLRENFSFRF